MSKVIEKVVAKHLETYLSTLRSHNNPQSAYCKGNSVETALMEVHYHITEVLAALVLLDLSEVFEIIDHTILQKCLE